MFTTTYYDHHIVRQRVRTRSLKCLSLGPRRRGMGSRISLREINSSAGRQVCRRTNLEIVEINTDNVARPSWYALPKLAESHGVVEAAYFDILVDLDCDI